MATQRCSWSSGGSPYVSFYLDADVIATQPAPNGAGYGRWLIRVYLRMSKGSGSFFNNTGAQYAYGNGSLVGSYSAKPFLPSGLTGWTKGPYDFWVNANSSGYWSGNSTSYPLQMQMVYGNVNVTVGGSIYLQRLSTAPSAPPAPVFSSATARSITFNVAPPGNTGGLPILDYRMQVATDATFNTIVRDWTAAGTSQTATSLDPSKSYAIRYSARNAAGSSGWSPTATMSTTAFSAPTIAVSPSISGAGATATMGASSPTEIDSYDVEYEYLAPPPIPTPATVSLNATTNTVNVSGLKPGASYRWRTRAHSGIFVTSWSDWVPVTQPAPSTSAGSYFDGSSPATDDQTFAWTGPAGNSTSVANGVGLAVWKLSLSGPTQQLRRAYGGFSGSYAALVTAIADQTLPGALAVLLGGDTYNTATGATGAAAVQPQQLYYGSAYVLPSRTIPMGITVQFFRADGTFISQTATTRTTAPAGTWTRLVVSGMAPPESAWARPMVMDLDVAPLQGGDNYLVDAGMITMGALYPYFDGSTPDSDQYQYDWVGTPNASASTRMPLDDNLEDILVDPDCPPVPSAPLPPTIDSSCIEETGIWRRYWVSIPASEVSTWKMMLPTIELRTGSAAARQVRIRTYPNPFGYAPETLDINDYCSEQIISFLPADTLLTLDGLTERAWAEVQGRTAIAADHLLYGTGGEPATWPTLSCGIAYTVSLDVPLDAPESNLDVAVSLTARG